MDSGITQELDASELRKFGLSTASIIAILFGALIPWVWDLRYPAWPWVILAVLGSWALIAPNSLRLVHRYWMRISSLISKVTTPIILGIAFFLVIAPIGLVFGMFNWDPLNRRFDAKLSTYRVDKLSQPAGSLENPY